MIFNNDPHLYVLREHPHEEYSPDRMIAHWVAGFLKNAETGMYQPVTLGRSLASADVNPLISEWKLVHLPSELLYPSRGAEIHLFHIPMHLGELELRTAIVENLDDGSQFYASVYHRKGEKPTYRRADEAREACNGLRARMHAHQMQQRFLRGEEKVSRSLRAELLGLDADKYPDPKVVRGVAASG